ncbi:hypothetical protein PR001_g26394 [Phytophthora rubi]|uniref:RxLR effector protein n=1 Tax=Phytophthora rubi TaxID=129364 RepID=A0A6A3HG46_9STRA|nr:hypothetical protein PR002_g27538 [Phytophthora rubi]KAE8973177.1 hypothetical protein PR001_g26394 [Phytophthora rubi]
MPWSMGWIFAVVLGGSFSTRTCVKQRPVSSWDDALSTRSNMRLPCRAISSLTPISHC